MRLLNRFLSFFLLSVWSMTCLGVDIWIQPVVVGSVSSSELVLRQNEVIAHFNKSFSGSVTPQFMVPLTATVRRGGLVETNVGINFGSAQLVGEENRITDWIWKDVLNRKIDVGGKSIAQLRKEKSADLVYLFFPSLSVYCRGVVLTESMMLDGYNNDLLFAVGSVTPGCVTTAHEIGHLLGLAHYRGETNGLDSGELVLPYGYGFYDGVAKIATIMADNRRGVGWTQYLGFSSPSASCDSSTGFCGRANSEDAVRVVTQTAGVLAAVSRDDFPGLNQRSFSSGSLLNSGTVPLFTPGLISINGKVDGAIHFSRMTIGNRQIVDRDWFRINTALSSGQRVNVSVTGPSDIEWRAFSESSRTFLNRTASRSGNCLSGSFVANSGTHYIEVKGNSSGGYTLSLNNQCSGGGGGGTTPTGPVSSRQVALEAFDVEEVYRWFGVPVHALRYRWPGDVTLTIGSAGTYRFSVCNTGFTALEPYGSDGNSGTVPFVFDVYQGQAVGSQNACEIVRTFDSAGEASVSLESLSPSLDVGNLPIVSTIKWWRAE